MAYSIDDRDRCNSLWPKEVANDAAHNPRPVAVVLAVVGRVDGGVNAGCGFSEGHVPFQTTSPDAASTAGLRAAKPRIVRPSGGADVEIVAGANDPHRHIGAQGAVLSCGRKL